MIRGNTVSETVLITGATGLVGAPTVSRFAADGWQVVGTAHRRSPKDVPTGVRIRPTDLSDQTDVERLVSEVAPAVIVSPGRRRSAADSPRPGSVRLGVGHRADPAWHGTRLPERLSAPFHQPRSLGAGDRSTERDLQSRAPEPRRPPLAHHTAPVCDRRLPPQSRGAGRVPNEWS